MVLVGSKNKKEFENDLLSIMAPLLTKVVAIDAIVGVVINNPAWVGGLYINSIIYGEELLNYVFPQVITLEGTEIYPIISVLIQIKVKGIGKNRSVN